MSRGARALGVERGGDQLLARPRLALDEDGGVRRRGGADDGAHLPHLRVVAEDAEVVGLARERALEQAVLAPHLLELQRALRQHDDLLGRERLLDVVEGSALDGLDGGVERAVRAHQNHLRLGRVGLDAREQADAVRVGQAQVNEDEVERAGGQKRLGVAHRPGRRHLPALLAEDEFERAPHTRLVVNHENSVVAHAQLPSAPAGRETRIVVPSPGRLVTAISPRCSSTTFLT
jgi:hypothetical protein